MAEGIRVAAVIVVVALSWVFGMTVWGIFDGWLARRLSRWRWVEHRSEWQLDAAESAIAILPMLWAAVILALDWSLYRWVF